MIYFDNAATTKCSDSTIKIVNDYLINNYFNPSSQYKNSVQIKKNIDEARDNILKLLNGKGKIVFTSSGTESDNIALLNTKKRPGSKIIISSTEHSAVYYAALELKNKGYEIIICPTDKHGIINLNAFEKLIDSSVSLVSVLHVNNETGAINDIKSIARIVKSVAPLALVHADGVQAVGKIPINLSDLDVDLYSISGHKIGGMKGSGALFLKDKVYVSPFLFGGGQEYGLRSSTENVAGILSLAEAIKDKVYNMNTNSIMINDLFNLLYNYLKNNPHIRILSDIYHGSKYILSFSNDLIKGEVLQNLLEEKMVIVGTGSACSSNKRNRRIAEALMLNDVEAEGIIRISFSPNNSAKEVNTAVEILDLIFKEYVS